MINRLFVLLIALSTTAFSHSNDQASKDLAHARSWLTREWNVTERHNYLMNADVRLLFFWIGADDVGGGYIQRASSQAEPHTESIEVLFGSDPQKAPRQINHWGAATEVWRIRDGIPPFSTFFGFMKSSRGKSVAEAQSEIASQQSGAKYAFEGNISLSTPNGMSSRVIPIFSDQDFSFREFGEARRMVLDGLEEPAISIRTLTPEKASCIYAGGFLHALDSLAAKALSLPRSKVSQCYVYNARPYTMTLVHASGVPAKTVRIKLRGGAGGELENKYRDLILAEFMTLNHDSREETSFRILFGTTGDLRGVPIQITHQPNWWFRVELNLI